MLNETRLKHKRFNGGSFVAEELHRNRPAVIGGSGVVAEEAVLLPDFDLERGVIEGRGHIGPLPALGIVAEAFGLSLRMQAGSAPA